MQDIDIGKKVQEYKKMRAMSNRTLSNLADISPSMLSQIEKSQANPSINTLKSIAQALDVPLYRFFLNDEETPAVSPVVRRKDRKIIGYPEHEGILYEMLIPDSSIEFCMMYLSPAMASSDKLFCHTGEEVACIMSGEATVLFDDVSYVLVEGDSIRIPPQTRHRWCNTSNEVTIVIFAVSPPSF